MNSFSELGLHEGILNAVQELGFEKPTPIQAKTIPILLESNQDVIGMAQTGTGKTAAFGLPAIHLTDLKLSNPQTLILCPTRELCLQISKDLESYSKQIKGLGIVAVYGGTSIEKQVSALRRNAQIVVGTPGRTKDLIKRKKLNLEAVTRVILDEADEMLTMGFKDDLEFILSKTSIKKQTLLFSATMSKDILNVTKKYMNNPLEIAVAQKNIAAANVSHVYYMVHARDRYEALKRICDVNPNIYGIAFCRTRRETKEVANKLMSDGYSADAIHGDLSQSQRDEVMDKFRTKQLQLLVATDVAARGLDVDDLSHVINYNLPDSLETYTHRSGRTGRAGKSGVSIAIIHTRERKKINEIERKAKVRFNQEKVPTGEEICTTQLYALIDKIEKVKVDEDLIEPFLPAIYAKLDWLDREELIKHFVSAEFNRFLSYYKNKSDLNVSGKSDSQRNKFNKRSENNFTRFYINIGSKNKLTPAKLIGLINQALRSGSAEIGKIEILKKFSFFEVESGMEEKLIGGLNGELFEKIPIMVEISQNTFHKPHVKKKKSHRGNRNKRYQGKSKRRIR